jgi:hypothetical protein
MTPVQEALLWMTLVLTPGHRVQHWNSQSKQNVTIQVYRQDGGYFGDREFGIDIRRWRWFDERNDQQTVIRYRKTSDHRLERTVERYDGYGALIEPEQTWPQ